MQGVAGPAGPIANIIDVVASVSDLPDPDDVPRDSAILVSTGQGGYDVYVVTGIDSLIWENVGPFSVGTVILVNGQAVQVVDLSRYLESPGNVSRTSAVTLSPSGATGAKVISADPDPDTVVVRRSDGKIASPDGGVYVGSVEADNKFYSIPPYNGQSRILCGFPSGGTNVKGYLNVAQEARGNAVPVRDSVGEIPLPRFGILPYRSTAANCMDVIDNTSKKLYKHDVVLTIENNGEEYVFRYEVINTRFTSLDFVPGTGVKPTATRLGGEGYRSACITRNVAGDVTQGFMGAGMKVADTLIIFYGVRLAATQVEMASEIIRYADVTSWIVSDSVTPLNET